MTAHSRVRNADSPGRCVLTLTRIGLRSYTKNTPSHIINNNSDDHNDNSDNHNDNIISIRKNIRVIL